MGWLVGPTLFSMGAAFIAVRIFDYIFSEVSDTAGKTARAGVFVGAWTAVTASTGMRGLNKRVRKLRALTRVSGISRKR